MTQGRWSPRATFSSLIMKSTMSASPFAWRRISITASAGDTPSPAAMRGEGLPLVLGPGRAPRDGDPLPAGVARHPRAVQRRPDARAVGGIGQPREERLAAAGVDPGRQERAEGRAARRVRVHVGGHVEALGARRLDQLDRLGHPRPVRPARGLEVADLHRDGGPAPDLDRLGDRRQERVALAPDVAGVEAPGLAGRPGQGDELVGVGEHARARRSGRWRTRRPRRPSRAGPRAPWPGAGRPSGARRPVP